MKKVSDHFRRLDARGAFDTAGDIDGMGPDFLDGLGHVCGNEPAGKNEWRVAEDFAGF